MPSLLVSRSVQATGCTLAILDPFVAYYSHNSLPGFYVKEKYVLFSCLSVLIWDIIHSLHDDYQLVTKHKFTTKTFVFLFSRVSTLLFFIFQILQTDAVLVAEAIAHANFTKTNPSGEIFLSPFGNAALIVADCFYVLSRSSTGLLLCFRVVAVYNNRPFVIVLFGLFWATLFALYSITLGPFNLFVGTYTGFSAISSFIAVSTLELANDLLIFLAIALRLNSASDPWPSSRQGSGWRDIFIFHRRVPGIPGLKVALLQDTQIYYLIAVCMNVLAFVGFFVTSGLLSTVNHADTGDTFLVYVNMVVIHIMATKVHRNLKLGKPGFMGGQQTTGLASLAFMQTPVAESKDDEDPDSTLPGRRRARSSQSTISRIMASSGIGSGSQTDIHSRGSPRRTVDEESPEHLAHGRDDELSLEEKGDVDVIVSTARADERGHDTKEVAV